MAKEFATDEHTESATSDDSTEMERTIAAMVASAEKMGVKGVESAARGIVEALWGKKPPSP